MLSNVERELDWGCCAETFTDGLDACNRSHREPGRSNNCSREVGDERYRSDNCAREQESEQLGNDCKSRKQRNGRDGFRRCSWVLGVKQSYRDASSEADYRNVYPCTEAHRSPKGAP